jgi:hypothetical protein
MKNKFGLVFAGAIVAVTCIASPAFSQRSYSSWGCYLNNVQENEKAGDVEIWWGHKPTDASWACNNWISNCRNNKGGCYANRIEDVKIRPSFHRNK